MSDPLDGATAPIDFSSPEVQEALKQNGYRSNDDFETAVEERNKRLEATKNSILDQNRKLKSDIESLPFTPETIAKLAEDPRTSNLVEKGWDSVISGAAGELQDRMDSFKIKAELDKQDFDVQLQSLSRKNEELGRVNKEVMIENKLGSLFVSNRDSILPTAHTDLLFQAKKDLDIDERGALFVKGENGPKQTADGRMTENDWFKEVMTEKPHYFQGASGAHNTGLYGEHVDTNNMTPEQKRKLGRKSRKIG